MVIARALDVLKQAENRATREATIRYTRHTAVGLEDVDIAANWEEVTQVLEVLACRPDLEEIQRQVTVILKAAETPAEKQALYEHLLNYLKRREEELHKAGGRDSLEYKREAAILQEVIQTYQLAQGTPAPSPTPTSPAPEPPPSQPEPTPETSASASSSGLEQLQQLMAMYQQGLLSEAEFQAAKKTTGAIEELPVISQRSVGTLESEDESNLRVALCLLTVLICLGSTDRSSSRKALPSLNCSSLSLLLRFWRRSPSPPC